MDRGGGIVAEEPMMDGVVGSPALGRGILGSSSFFGGGTGVDSPIGVIEPPPIKGPRPLIADCVERAERYSPLNGPVVVVGVWTGVEAAGPRRGAILPPVVSGSVTTLDWNPFSFIRFLYSENVMRRTEGALGGDGCLGATVGVPSWATGLGAGADSTFAGGLGGSRDLGGVGGRSAVDDISACGCSSSSIRLSCLGEWATGGVVRILEGLKGRGGAGAGGGEE